MTLVIDDDIGFLRAAKIALERTAPEIVVHLVRTGGQGLAFLEGTGRFANAPRPDFVVLDYKLPDMTATTILERMQALETLRSIPVLVLTQAVWHDEKEAALAAGARVFSVKPSAIQGLRDALTNFRRQHVHGGQGPAD